MKFLLILLLFTTTVLSEEEKQKLTIGLGPYIQNQPYKDTQNIILPSPVIFFDNGLVYIRWSRAGIYFLGNKGDEFSWGVSLSIQPRVQSLDPSTSDELSNITEKNLLLRVE